MKKICLTALAVLGMFGAQTALATHPAISIADAVERVIPGVVNIRVLEKPSASDTTILKQNNFDNFFQIFMLPGLLGHGGQTRASGSGFFYMDHQTIVTNWHVVKDADVIEIVVAEKGARYRATLLGYDPRADIALLRTTETFHTRNLVFGKTDKIRIGDGVFAIGNPFGYGHTVTSGILSAKGRTIGSGPLDEFLQTDAAINPGNSGGPLFNFKGEVIGINTATSVDGHGISFAIPSESAMTAIDAILKHRTGERPWLGIVGSNLADGQDQDASGVYVQNLVKGSPAEMGGLKTGDVILKINSKPATDLASTQRALSKVQPGAKVSLRVFRNGSQVKLELQAVDAKNGNAGGSF